MWYVPPVSSWSNPLSSTFAQISCVAFVPAFSVVNFTIEEHFPVRMLIIPVLFVLSFAFFFLFSFPYTDASGWWKGKLKGKIGLFPYNYVEKVAWAGSWLRSLPVAFCTVAPLFARNWLFHSCVFGSVVALVPVGMVALEAPFSSLHIPSERCAVLGYEFVKVRCRSHCPLVAFALSMNCISCENISDYCLPAVDVHPLKHYYLPRLFLLSF